VDGFNSYFVSYAASRGVSVSLSGTGGDELFLGYPWFGKIQHSVNGTSPFAEHSVVGRLLNLLKKEPRAPDAASFRELFGLQYHCFGPSEALDLLSSHRSVGIVAHSFAEDLAICDELPHGDWLDRSSVMCLNGYTRNQLLRDIDACSMAHSLEVRVPFLDVNIADFAFSLPVTSKLAMTRRTLDPLASYKESGVKKIVCDVARRYLPQKFFDARGKRGFGLPYEYCLREPLAELLSDTLSQETVRKAGLFDSTTVQRVHHDFLAGRRPWAHPWLLMITELWRQEVLRT
jgi:asparagine synthase (glutamine-hydrolysing)